MRFGTLYSPTVRYQAARNAVLLTTREYVVRTAEVVFQRI